MPEPPTGKVVFLFTDIEGSTRLWERHPEPMKAALARHDELLRGRIEAHGGYVFKTIGDAFCAAFPSADEGVAAGLEIQRALHAGTWEVPGGIRVRMALHAGETVERGGDYYGPPVNRVARLLSAGHGGQTLLSGEMCQSLGGRLPPGVTLRDMGQRRLKDLVEPEHVFQVDAPDLPDAFPPLKTLDERPNNLPSQPTPLIGRDADVAAVRRLLMRESIRLVTLSGPGGTGKTRLSIQAATDALDQFDDGVCWAALGEITDPGLFASTIAHALMVKEEGGRPLLETLKEAIGDRQLLLVLDNFEQVVEAAPQLGELLSACPRFKALVTSRIVLRVYGEQEYPVSPLALPDRRRLPPVEALRRNPAVALFVERAAAVKPDFTLTEENKAAVAEICARLDGLPLAIELAAARVKLLAPQAMLPRLESALKLLTGGSRDLPARQQTLRGAIAYSYDLMTADERTLWQRLSVFAGGCSFEGAEIVGSAEGDLDTDSLDGLASLVDKSLLRREELPNGEPRFRMLQTIREFAGERLEESGEVETIRRRHADCFLALAEATRQGLSGPKQVELLEHLEVEHDNLRAALDWLAGSGQAATALRLGAALWRFWDARGHLGEGYERLQRLLAAVPEPTSERAQALRGAGSLASDLGDFAAARGLYEESREICQTLGDRRGYAYSLNNLGLLQLSQGDVAAARGLLEEALAIRREVNDRNGVADTVNNLGLAAYRLGDYATARAHYEESQALQRQLGNRQRLALTLTNLGWVATRQGDLARAEQLFRESLDLRRELQNAQDTAASLNALGNVAMFQEDHEAARARFEECLELLRGLGARPDIAAVLTNLGQVAEKQGDLDAARAYLEEGLAIDEGLGERLGVAYSLGSLAGILEKQGDLAGARTFLNRSLSILEEIGDRSGIAYSLENHATLAVALGDPVRGLTLAAAAARLRQETGEPLPPTRLEELEMRLGPAREGLGTNAAAAEARGRGMTLEEAVALALG